MVLDIVLVRLIRLLGGRWLCFVVFVFVFGFSGGLVRLWLVLLGLLVVVCRGRVVLV